MRLSHFWGGLVGPKQWVKDHLRGDRGRRPRQCQDRAGRRCQGRWRQGAAVLGARTASVPRSSLFLAPTLAAAAVLMGALQREGPWLAGSRSQSWGRGVSWATAGSSLKALGSPDEASAVSPLRNPLGLVGGGLEAAPRPPHSSIEGSDGSGSAPRSPHILVPTDTHSINR